jgi:thiol-disulfide isomerase/thioredoxin
LVIKIPHRRTSLRGVRKAVYAIIALGLVAVVAIGLVQSSNSGDKPSGTLRSRAPSAAATERALRGSPPPLAALHDRASGLVPGGKARYKSELAALRGHPVVVNFWASWCGPCRLEFPAFQVQSVHFGRRIGFLGVNSGDNHGNARKFLADFPVSYPSIEDPGQRVAQEVGPRGLPATAYYDAKGKLAFVHQGYYGSDAALARDIDRYTRQ